MFVTKFYCAEGYLKLRESLGWPLLRGQGSELRS
jgi:hypothetical protein